MKSRILTCFLIGLTALFIGCNKEGNSSDAGSGGGGGGGSSSSSGEIIIGHVASLTGDTATFGVSSDEGHPPGPRRDQQSRRRARPEDQGHHRRRPLAARRGQDRRQKLITRDKASSRSSARSRRSRSIAIAPVCAGRKIPMLSPGSTNPKVTEVATTSSAPASSTRSRARPWRGSRWIRTEARAEEVRHPLPRQQRLRRGPARVLQRRREEGAAGRSSPTRLHREERRRLHAASSPRSRQANPDAIFVTGYYTEAGPDRRAGARAGHHRPADRRRRVGQRPDGEDRQAGDRTAATSRTTTPPTRTARR